jgi:hypothetical protein
MSCVSTYAPRPAKVHASCFHTVSALSQHHQVRPSAKRPSPPLHNSPARLIVSRLCSLPHVTAQVIPRRQASLLSTNCTDKAEAGTRRFVCLEVDVECLYCTNSMCFLREVWSCPDDDYCGLEQSCIVLSVCPTLFYCHMLAQ